MGGPARVVGVVTVVGMTVVMTVVGAAVVFGSCTEANPEYVVPQSGCQAGARACVGSRPVECVPSESGGGVSVLRNVPCPAAGGCVDGRCVAPAGAAPCTREQDCAAGESCAPFVAEGKVRTFCVSAEGPVAGGLPCAANTECRSNLCLITGGNVANRLCFLSCEEGDGCPLGWKCRNYTVTVTGVQGNIMGCGPK